MSDAPNQTAHTNPADLKPVKKGQPIEQMGAAVSTMNMSVTPESLVNVVRVKLRTSFDEAIKTQAQRVGQAADASNAAEAAVLGYKHQVPDDFKNDVLALEAALKPFFSTAHAVVEEVAGTAAQTSTFQATGKVLEHAGRQAGTIVIVQRAVPVSEEFKALLNAAREARQRHAVESAELVRLRTDRGRLNELAEEAYAALTLHTVSNFEGGEEYAAALEKVGSEITKRLKLPALPAPKE